MIDRTKQDAPPSPQEIYRVVREDLAPYLPELGLCQSTAELLASATYRSIRPAVETVLESPEIGDFTAGAAPPRSSYRLVAWNLERGIEYEGQLQEFRRHPYLSSGDVLLLTETDVGMARSANRAVAQDLARELEMHYAFAPCYLNLSKGAGVEHDSREENDLGLHGNAILSRYPIGNVPARSPQER